METRLEEVVDSGLKSLGAFEDTDGFANGKRLLVCSRIEPSVSRTIGPPLSLVLSILPIRCRKTSSPLSQSVTRKGTTMTAERMIPSRINAAPGSLSARYKRFPSANSIAAHSPGNRPRLLPVSGRGLR